MTTINRLSLYLASLAAVFITTWAIGAAVKPAPAVVPPMPDMTQHEMTR